jgi:2-iminobutanoate/2-iminopropanoate deaminase
MKVKATIQPAGYPTNPLLSPAVKVGNLVYTSGLVGRVPGTGHVPDDIAAQSRQTLQNIETVLQAAGSSLDQVVKLTIYLVNLDDKQTFNAVYQEFFPTNPPARTCIECSRLDPQFLVEVEAVAAIP